MKKYKRHKNQAAPFVDVQAFRDEIHRLTGRNLDYVTTDENGHITEFKYGPRQDFFIGQPPLGPVIPIPKTTAKLGGIKFGGPKLSDGETYSPHAGVIHTPVEDSEETIQSKNPNEYDSPTSGMNKREEILYTASKLINGDRADIYGPPEESFGRIANLWNDIGFRTKNGFKEVDAVDVALALVLLKVSRTISSPDHEDNWIDIAGYAGLGAEMALRNGDKSDG